MVTTAIALAFVIFFARIISAGGTTLGNLAASMEPGTWAEITTTNITATLSNTGGASGTILPYSDDGVWDPASRQFFFVGGDHNPSSGCPRFVSYTESTDAW